MAGALTRDRRQEGERGAVLIELAVVVPIIAVIGLGVLEFANYFYSYQLIQNGIRDAARYAASVPYDSTKTTQNDTAIKNIATSGITATDPSKQRLSWWGPSTVTVTWGTVPNPGGTKYRYAGNVPVVTVSTSVQYPSLGFLKFLKLGTMNLKFSHQERVFGVR